MKKLKESKILKWQIIKMCQKNPEMSVRRRKSKYKFKVNVLKWINAE